MNEGTRPRKFQIDGRDVSKEEFDALLQTLTRSETLFCEKTNGGGTDAFIAKNKEGMCFRVQRGVGVITFSSIDLVSSKNT
jgi:hypothetical protein